jgi:hypothetical protein
MHTITATATVTEEGTIIMPVPPDIPVGNHEVVVVIDPDPLARNQAAAALIRQWLADESGYDEENWPSLKKAIEENRLSERPRFHE